MSLYRSAHFVKLYNSHEVYRFLILSISLHFSSSFREKLLSTLEYRILECDVMYVPR